MKKLINFPSVKPPKYYDKTFLTLANAFWSLKINNKNYVKLNLQHFIHSYLLLLQSFHDHLAHYILLDYLLKELHNHG